MHSESLLPTKKEQSFQRTMVTSLRVQGYRSLREVEIADLSSLVVIHGANGTGKSNIIRAVQHILFWASASGFLPSHPQHARELSEISLPSELGITRDDFSRGELPEIRIALEMQVGCFAKKFLGEEMVLPVKLSLEAIAQDTGEKIIYWFRKAQFGTFSLLENKRDESDGGHGEFISQTIRLQERVQALTNRIWEHEQKLSKSIMGQRRPDVMDIKTLEQELRKEETKLRDLEMQLSKEELLSTRVKTLLLPRLLQHFSAYRTGFAKETLPTRHHPITSQTVRDFELQNHFLTSWISQDRERRQSVTQLGRRLRQAGYEVKGVTPIWNSEQEKAQLLIETPDVGELPMSQVGTGMQQLIFLLGGIFANPSAIVMIEEPEAHLHKDTMLSLAEYFQVAVEDVNGIPDIDQLWLETHHHAFALALEYLDVSKDGEGWTKVQKKPRSRAIEHFYEPSPFWEALRQLVADALEDDDVVFRDASGQPVTAGNIRESIEGDREIANEYVKALTEMTVASLRRKSKE